MADDGTGPGGQEGTQPGVDTPNAAQGTQPGDSPPKAGVFTQADLDRIVGERLAKAERRAAKAIEEARQSALVEFRAQHGLDDDDTLQRLTEAPSELEKIRRELKAERAKAQRLEKDLTGALEQHRSLRDQHWETALRNQVTSVASEMGALDLDLVWAGVRGHLDRTDDYDTVVKGDDGEPSEKTVPDFVRGWLQQHRTLLPDQIGAGANSRSGRSSSAKGQPDFARDRDARLRNLERLIGKR